MSDVPSFFAGELLAASKLQQLGYQDSWTPVLEASTSDPDLGTDPTQSGLIWRNGNRIDLWFGIRFGTSASGGSGTYQIPLPLAAATVSGIGYPLHASALETTHGTCRLIEAGVGETQGVANISNNQYIYFRATEGSASGLVTATNPFTFGDTDWVLGHVSYLTDFAT